MKKFLLGLIILAASSAYPQEQVLISGNVSHGGFGGPVLKLGQFDGDLGVLVGGRGGWIINHAFTIGGGGYGLVNDIPMLTDDLGKIQYLNFNYGGFEMGFILASNRLLHLSVNGLVGGGSLGYRESSYNDEHKWDENSDHDEIFVIEPAVNLIVNITPWFRIGAGVSYRTVTGVDLVDIDNEFLSGPSAVLALKFGSF